MQTYRWKAFKTLLRGTLQQRPVQGQPEDQQHMSHDTWTIEMILCSLKEQNCLVKGIPFLTTE